MPMPVPVRDVMHAPVVVSPAETLAAVFPHFAEDKNTALLVEENGELAGILTDGDLLRAFYVYVASSRPDPEHFLRLTVRDAMTVRPRPVSPHTRVEEVARLMHKWHVKHVPVVDDGKIVGLVKRVDVISSLFKKTVA